MTPEIRQALQQGIVAHRKGNFREAERLYRVVLKSYPKNADACHNLGLLAIAANKPAVALPLFKTALDANRTVEQYWVSYITALIKEDIGWCLFNQGEVEPARPILKKHLQ